MPSYQWPPISGGGGGVSSVTASSPLASSGGATPNISIQNADATHTGALTSTDWNTFNNKANASLNNLSAVAINASLIPNLNGAINLGSAAKEWGDLFVNNLKDSSGVSLFQPNNRQLLNTSGTPVIDFSTTTVDFLTHRLTSIVNPTGPQDAATKSYVDAATSAAITSINTLTPTAQFLVTGTAGTDFGIVSSVATHTFNLPVASASNTGKLSNSDWSTFNSKQAAGNYITALTGDVTATGPGSVAATLATVNGNVGSFGSSTSIPNFTVNAKGLITAAGSNVVIAPAGTLTGTTLASNVVTSSLTSLGIQSVALNMGSHQINAVTNPTSAQDAATKNYVDTAGATYLVKTNNLSDVSSPSTSFANISPLTTAGDIIYENNTPAPARLPIGTAGQVLTVVSGLPAWQPAGGGGGSGGSELMLSTGNGHGSVNQNIRRYSNVLTDTGTGVDWTYADSATDGMSVTIINDGVYQVDKSDYRTTGACSFGVSKNAVGADLTTALQSINGNRIMCITSASTNLAAACGNPMKLVNGDIIRSHDDATEDAADNFVRFHMVRVS